jgi:hypothetical protein
MVWHLCHLQALPDPKADAKTDKSAEAAAFSCGG